LNDSADVPGGAVGFTRLNCSGPGCTLYAFDGAQMANTTDADVAVVPGLTQSIYEGVLTHELGHSLSLRHSNERTPSATNAAMNATCCPTGGASLAQWDHDAISTVYNPSPGGTCNPPGVPTASANPTTISQGSSSQLSASATGTNPTFTWFTGNPGNTSNQVGSGATINVSPATTTSYWVRASACSQTADSASSVTVTVQCVAPTQANASTNTSTVVTGGQATLSVNANGSGTLSFQWFTGNPPSGTQITGATSSSFTTAPLSSTTTYYAQVRNACGGPINSASVTVNVAAACTPPSNAVVTATPPSIQSGQTANLGVLANGTGLTFQWFTGAPPNGAAIPGATAANIPVTPATTTTYFARVTGQCGTPIQIDSNAVTVTVTAACTDPTVTTQPASQTIIVGGKATLTVVAGGTAPLHYQWFEGTSGDTSKPRGTDSPAFTTSALTTKTQFWVQVRGNCTGDKRANSNTATIDVKPPRGARPVRH
ncbi:MAG TPA: hypothetical protein VKJ07_12985, partial [Mycobacteriales bacterium]|nr:hypothetical protein [Mycobacteriales bacterium]